MGWADRTHTATEVLFHCGVWDDRLSMTEWVRRHQSILQYSYIASDRNSTWTSRAPRITGSSPLSGPALPSLKLAFCTGLELGPGSCQAHVFQLLHQREKSLFPRPQCQKSQGESEKSWWRLPSSRGAATARVTWVGGERRERRLGPAKQTQHQRPTTAAYGGSGMLKGRKRPACKGAHPAPCWAGDEKHPGLNPQGSNYVQMWQLGQ